MNNTGITIAVVFAALTGAGGFFLGKGSSEEGAAQDGLLNSAKSGVNITSNTKGSGREGGVQPNLRGFELSQNPRVGLEILMEELRQSPMAQMDFEALFGIWDMVQYLDAYELAALMADLEEMGGGQEMMAVRMMLLNRWAAKDGPAAMESVFEGERGPIQMIGAMGAMMGWMRSDPEQAFSWFQENGDRLGGGAMGIGKEQIEAMYFASKAKTDFDGTMAQLDGMDAKTKKAVIEQLAQTAGMNEERRAELLDYLKTKDDDDLINKARQSIVQQMAWQDPKAAIAFIESEETDAETQEDLIKTTTSMWSHSDPQGAVKYLGEELRGKENAGDEISNSFGNWVGRDEAGAAEWLAQQPEEFQSDSVFQSAGQNLSNNGEYERSAEWYGQILDEEERTRTYGRLYNEWGQSNQEEADAWREGLPAEVQETFGPSAAEGN